jgi:hypothetical protein
MSVTSPDITRLNKIAQQLDELADDGPSELSDIAEQLGAIADRLDTRVRRDEEALNRRTDGMPKYLREIDSILQHHIRQHLMGVRDLREYEYRVNGYGANFAVDPTKITGIF